MTIDVAEFVLCMGAAFFSGAAIAISWAARQITGIREELEGVIADLERGL